MTEIFSSNILASLETERAKIGFRKALLVTNRKEAEEFAIFVDALVVDHEYILPFAYDGLTIDPARKVNSKEETTRLVIDFILDKAWGMFIGKGKPPKWSP